MIAGNLTPNATLNLVAFRAGAINPASTSYAIGSDGSWGLGVEETGHPWTSASSTNDSRAITFEIANNAGAPDWRMSDHAINRWMDMSVDILRFYGYDKLNYVPKPSNITISQVETWIRTWSRKGEAIVTLHDWFIPTTCPGPYFKRQLPWLVREINKRLQNPNHKPEWFVGEGWVAQIQSPSTNQNGSNQRPTNPSPEIFQNYMITIAVPALNIRRGPGTNHPVVTTLMNDRNTYTIVEEANGIGANRWGRLKSGAGWIALDHTRRR